MAIAGFDASLNASSHRSFLTTAVLSQSPMTWAVDSIANPHLHGDLGKTIPFPDEIRGLMG
jgi:hypothetical protein